MSDFFYRLAQRALGQAEVIQPLIPSHHASTQPDAPFEEVVEEIPVAPHTAEPAASPPAAPNESTPRGPAEPREPDGAASLKADLPVGPEATVQRSRARAAGIEDGGEAQGRQAPTTVLGTPPGPVETRMVRSHDVTAMRLVEAIRPAGHADAAVPVTSPRVTHADAPAGDTATGDSTAVHAPQQTRSVLDDERRQAPIRPDMPEVLFDRPGREPRHRDSRRQPAEPAFSAPPAESVIEVHIGRIEVHAAAEQPTAASEGPRQPAMSLADYLDLRNGGRR